MLIPDTSVWIEFFRRQDPFFDEIGRRLERAEIIGIPWIFGELFQGAKNSAEVKILLRVWAALPKPEMILYEKAWIAAGTSSFRGKWLTKGIGLIDAAIVGIADELSVPVWTLDKQLSPVLKFKRLLWKEVV